MNELKIACMTIGVCATNCYYVYREGSTEVIVFDPADRGGDIYHAITEKGFKIGAILLTHGHFDHIWGAEELRSKSGARIYAYEKEQPMCESSNLNLSAQMGRACTIKVDCYRKDGEKIRVGNLKCRLLATPGHTAGSCCYYFEEDGKLFSGDTLFCQSVGRTDFPTGSMSEIVRSVKEKLMVLPDEVKVYPGHGDTTTIGFERENNPFL